MSDTLEKISPARIRLTEPLYGRLLGQPKNAQILPAITATNEDYAMVVHEDGHGDLIDNDGNIVESGNPREISKKRDLWFLKEPEPGSVDEFWINKFPEYFKVKEGYELFL